MILNSRHARAARAGTWHRMLVATLASITLTCLLVSQVIALTSAVKEAEKRAQKQAPEMRLRASELKRLEANTTKIESVKVSRAKQSGPASKSTARLAKGKGKAKTQTRRLMRSTDEQLGASTSQRDGLRQAGSGADALAASSRASDSWSSAHSLVPTFADLEMGDEMVALASDAEPLVEQQVKALPQVNRSQLSSSSFMQSFSKDSSDNDRFQREVEQQMSGTAAARQAAGQAANAPEDYYTDEEDEEEEQPAAGGAKSAENKRFRGGYNYQQAAGFQLNQFVNGSRAGSRPDEGAEARRQQTGDAQHSWLPAEPIRAEPQRQPSEASQASILRRPQEESKRIVGMFGGRDTLGSSLTKTDIAIEYLRNMLKTKQSQQQASATNSTGSSPQQENSERKARAQSAAFYPLPMVMSDYASNKANQSEQGTNSTGRTSEAPRLGQNAAPARYEAKFSIQDVKEQQQQKISLVASAGERTQYTLVPTSFAPPTLAPFQVNSADQDEHDRRFTRPAAAPSSGPDQSNKSRPPAPIETPAASGMPNGTPLGGDYIESLDESPRPLQQAGAQSAKRKLEPKTAKSREAKLGAESLSASASELRDSAHYSPLSSSRPNQMFPMGQQQLEQAPPPSAPNRDFQSQPPPYFGVHPLGQTHSPISQSLPQQSQPSALAAIAPTGEIRSFPEVTPIGIKGAARDEGARVELALSKQPARSPSEVLFESIGRRQQQRVAEASRAPSQLPTFSSANRTFASERAVAKAPLEPAGLELNEEPMQEQLPLEMPPAGKTAQISPAFERPATEIGQQMADVELEAPRGVRGKHAQTAEQMQQYREPQLPPAIQQLIHEQEHQFRQFQQFHQQQQHRYRQEHTGTLQQGPPTTQVFHETRPIEQQQHHTQHQKLTQHHYQSHPHPQQQFPEQQKQLHGELQQHAQAAYHEQKQQEQPQQPQGNPQANQQGNPQAHNRKNRIHVQQSSEEPRNYAAAKSFQQQAREQQGEERPPSSAQMQKPPRIVSYNYFESGEPGDESQEAHKASGAHATSFQFGDSLLSSTGDVEHMLTQAELEAIQRQFLTAEHPVVPLNEQQQSVEAARPEAGPEARQQLISSLKAAGANISPDFLSQLSSPLGHAEDSLRVLASNNQESRQQPRDSMSAAASETAPSAAPKSEPAARLTEAKAAGEKKKSLIVYLNHPRGDEMSKAASSSEDNLAQLISEQTSGDPFVSAKEFDSHGLSKETKHLDVSRLRLEAGKEAQDKDGLSVVVIGDAYKYKKIVLLISSKPGGLKFIPMVKDMRR